MQTQKEFSYVVVFTLFHANNFINLIQWNDIAIEFIDFSSKVLYKEITKTTYYMYDLTINAFTYCAVVRCVLQFVQCSLSYSVLIFHRRAGEHKAIALVLFVCIILLHNLNLYRKCLLCTTW